ncbi:MAG TPA: hypothetical protein PLB35_11435 [Myxococcota bacterium]|nr:hypothetical protein [Myxococcota bacterium]HOH77856.1 hypothetical protein [Myxococcota bacterium]
MTNLLKLKVTGIALVTLTMAIGCGGDPSPMDDNGNLEDVVVPDQGNPTDTNGQDTNGQDANIPEDTNGQDTNGQDTNIPEDTNGQDTNGQDTNIPEDTNGQDTNGQDTNIPEDTNGQDTNGQDTNGQDTNVVDNGTVIDVTEPPTCPANQDIANLLTQTEGDVDVTICGAVVTKVTANGWYMADDSSNRGMYVYQKKDEPWGYEVEVGDYVQMHVTKFVTFEGLKEITAKENVTIQGKADHREYILDLSEGTLPAESIESRVVRINDVKVTAATGKNGTIDYGTATNVPVFVQHNDIPCIGLEADIVAGVVSVYNSKYQIMLTEDADLANVSLANCETPPEYDMSNWDFEKQSVEEDPPEGFTKGPGNTFTCVRDADGGNNGSAGIVLTWTSTDNQELVQGYKFPTAAGSTVIFALDVLDNDSAGRVRLGLSFYDADKKFITGSNSWSNDYSTDSADWQALSFQAVAPTGAAFAEGKLRMYDYQPPEGTWGNPTASATIAIDNWEMVSVEP